MVVATRAFLVRAQGLRQRHHSLAAVGTRRYMSDA